MRNNTKAMWVLISMVVAIMARGQNAAQSSGNALDLYGTVVVKPVDPYHVIVAIDTGNEGRERDGVIDHIFLVTVSAQKYMHRVIKPGWGHIEFLGNYLILVRDDTPKGERDAVEFIVRSTIAALPAMRPGTLGYWCIGLSHHTGWSDLRLEDLNQVQQSTGHPDRFWAGKHELVFP